MPVVLKVHLILIKMGNGYWVRFKFKNLLVKLQIFAKCLSYNILKISGFDIGD